MQLQTERLILREFTLEDFDAVHVYGADPGVTRFTSFGPNTLAESEDFLTRAAGAALTEPRRSYDLAIVREADGLLLGGVGLHLSGTGLTGGCGPPNVFRAELGYVLRTDVWGHGFAAEAGTAMVGYGFGALGLHRIFAECHTANRASERVMEKIGMQREGLLRQHARITGEWCDVVVCGMLRDEWTG
jgi:ribosomal-protein-alanine N-acetyltransferase